MIQTHNIFASRIINIDKSGLSADNANVRPSRQKLYALPKTTSRPPSAIFANVNLITLLGCVRASGEVRRPKFVLQARTMRYRKYPAFSNPDTEYLETIADCLPLNALVATRKDVPSVHKSNFVAWARSIVKDLADVTSNGRKALLIYDGYRSHMCSEALEMFR